MVISKHGDKYLILREQETCIPLLKPSKTTIKILIFEVNYGFPEEILKNIWKSTIKQAKIFKNYGFLTFA